MTGGLQVAPPNVRNGSAGENHFRPDSGRFATLPASGPVDRPRGVGSGSWSHRENLTSATAIEAAALPTTARAVFGPRGLAKA